MSQIVKLRRSSTPGNKPTTSQLDLGELAINTNDGKIYFEKSSSLGESIQEIIVTNAWNTGSVNISGSVTITGSFINNGLTYPLVDNGEKSFIQSDGAGNLTLQYVNTIYENVRNKEVSTMPKGTPIYISGSTGANPNAYFGNAGDPNRMPVVYIAGEDILPNETGLAIILGLIEGVDTALYPPGTEVYVGVGGGWTSTRPTGSAIVQSLGYVTKQGVGGQGVVLNPGPFNLPNLNSGSLWIGNSSSVPIIVTTSSIVVDLARTASYALSSSYALNATNASTASYVATASYIPNLQEVTDRGATTTTPITASSILSNGSVSIRSGAPYLELLDSSTSAIHYVEGTDSGLNIMADYNQSSSNSTINFKVDGNNTRMSLSATELITFGATDTGEAHIFGGSARVNGTLDTYGGMVNINKDNEFLRNTAQSSSVSQFQSWYNSSGTRRGYFGFPSAGDNTLALVNETGGSLSFTGAATFSSSVTADTFIASTIGGSPAIQLSGNDPSNAQVRIINGNGNSYSIISGIPSVSNSGFSIRNNTANTNLLVFNNSGAATFSGEITTTNGLLKCGGANTYVFGDNTDLYLGTGGNARLTILANGAATFSSSVNANVFNSANDFHTTNDAYIYSSAGAGTVGAGFLLDGTNSKIRAKVNDTFVVDFNTTSFDVLRAATFSSTLTTLGNLTVQGGGSGYIKLYSAYSGIPSNVGLEISNYAGTLTFYHNSNGGGTYIGGVLTQANNIIQEAGFHDLRNTTYLRFSNTGGGTRWGYIQHDGSNLAYIADVGVHAFTGAATFSSSVTAGGALLVNNNAITQDGNRPIFTLQQSGVNRLILGISSGSGDIITGDVYGDVDFRTSGSSAFNFSVNNGSSIAFKISSSGAAIFNSTLQSVGNTYLGTTSGIVGIGTTSPNGNSATAGLLHLNAVGSAYSEIHLTNTTTGTTNVDGGSLIMYDTSLNLINFENDYLAFGTNNTERVRITGGGNVGINTSPNSSYQLIVNSSTGIYNTLFTDSTNSTSRYNVNLFTAAYTSVTGYTGIGGATTANASFNDSFVVGTQTAHPLKLNTSDTERVRVTAAGNVGIGTTSPAVKLDVNGSINLATGNNLTWGGAYGANIPTIAANSGASSLLAFYPGGSTSGETMRITNAGNVGIGYTSPVGRLSVAGATYINTNANISGLTSPKLTVIQTAGTADWTVGIKGGTGNNGSFGLRVDGGTTTSDYNMLLLNSTATLTYFSVKGDGYVGVGTASPQSLLHIDGVNPFLRVSNTSGDNHGIKISYLNSDTHGLHLLYNGNAATASIDNTYPAASGQPYGDLYFRQNVGGTMTIRMMIKADGGNVGIGTTTPTLGTLQVNGNIYATSFTGSLQGTSSFATTASYAASTNNITNAIANNTNNYILTAQGTGIINGESNLQYDGNGLFIGNAGSIPGAPTDGTVLYSEDVASSSELKVKDEAGNITTLSPHNFSLIPEGPSEPLAWSYYSEKEGKKINVDMLKLARILEKLTGEKLVYME
jgi:hypothetical protein